MKRLHRIQGKERVPFSPSSLVKTLSFFVFFCFLLFSSGCTDLDDSNNEAELIEISKNVSDSGSEMELIEVA
ncbi:MAG: thioredoxin, partial [Methanosarcina sp.]|nr:thioredoxin [Methanosarcina sp.]